MVVAVARSSIRPGGCLSSSESQDLTVSLLKIREILFQQALISEADFATHNMRICLDVAFLVKRA